MRKNIHLETERTILRELTELDAESFYNLNQDLEVLKYTGDKPFQNVNSAKEFLKNYDQYKLFGVGRLAVIDKKSTTFIGWCGLKYNAEKDEFDIGFRFFKEYWNKDLLLKLQKNVSTLGSKNLK